MRILLPFTFASSIAFSSVFAQQSRLDSLMSLLDGYRPDDSIKVDLMNKVAFEYVNSNPKLTSQYSETAYNLAQKLDYKKGIGHAMTNLANAQWMESEYELALNHYLHALDIYKSIDDFEGIYIVYNNLGEVYKKLEKLDEALRYHQISLDLKQESSPDIHPAMSHYNIGEIFFMKKKYKEAIMEFETAEWMTIENGNLRVLAYTNTGLGKVFLEMKNFVKSKKYLEQANALWQDLNDLRGLAYVNLDLGRLNFEMNDWANSQRYLENALQITRQSGMRDIQMGVLAQMQKLDSARGDMASALNLLRQYIQLKDSIFNMEKEKLVANIQARHELDEKERINKQLVLAKETSEEIVNYQKIIIGAFVIILILIGVLAISFYRQVKRTHKLNAQLESKNQEIQISAKELQVLNNDLEKMVEQRTSVIHQKNDQFKEYSFLNAHYVRGPLANIIGLSNLLDTDSLDCDQKTLLHHILDSSTKLDHVLHEIKEKLEKGEVIS